MTRNASIVPTILSNNEQVYRKQVEVIGTFARRVQIDVADGTFTQTKTLSLKDMPWPKNWSTDLHLMTAKPSAYLEMVLKLNPSLCILHAEAGENLIPMFENLKKSGIRVGVALLPSTYPGNAKQYINVVDHVLVFAGQLGAQGGQADLMQMEKIPLIRSIKPEVEIGWDGGANMSNIRALAHADLDVINVGSAISKSPQPVVAFRELAAEADKNGVAL